jgi:N-6 DNA Methylase
MARAFDIPLKDGVELAAIQLRRTNTLIGTALNLLTQDEANQQSLKTSLGTLTRVLNEVNWSTLSKDKPEAWLYFYEHFLEVYDNRLRKLTGSYYTPPEVVEAMVNLVDQALRGPLFERAAGLASSDVTLADPAVGTGTFLLGALRKIAANVEKDQGAGAVGPAIAAAAKRLFGFELQFEAVRGGAIATAGRNAIPDQDGGKADPAGTQPLHHRHARQSLRRGGAIAADRRGHRQITA